MDLSRRDFLRSTPVVALGALVAPGPVRGADPAPPPATTPTGRQVGVAVVGLGPWGREILSALARLPMARVAAVCDLYPGALKRAAALAPGALAVTEPGRILGDASIRAVCVATPTHLHRAWVEDALKAGKHVYCEAPLASDLADAKGIARAARAAAPRLHFQGGLQGRSHPERVLAADFIRSGVAGRPVLARSQWLKKHSWRHAAADPEREKAINWRLDPAVSLGLGGEVGIHHFDSVSWFMGARPLSVAAVGALRHWRQDDRALADTVFVTLEYPDGFRFVGTYTLANSFDGECELFHGADATVMFRGARGWMFKEADAPLLGWEVHARKDAFYRETGLVLMANASKRSAPDGETATEVPPATPPVQSALEAFVRTAADLDAAAEDFAAAYGGDDPKALAAHLATVARQPGAGWQESLEATVVAIRARESAAVGRPLEFEPALFELG